MAQSGIHAFAGIILSKFLKCEKKLIPPLVFGLMLPDLDIILVAMGIMSFENTSLMHSIFFITLTYLLFLSLSEITSNKQFQIVGKGISIGIFLHILIDALFWFKSIYAFWPLSDYDIAISNTKYAIIPYTNKTLIHVLLALEFLLFRIYGWFLIEKYIKNPLNKGWFIKYISRWMKIEFILFLLSLLLIYFNISNYKAFFIIMYIPSLIMALISIYILRDVFSN